MPVCDDKSDSLAPFAPTSVYPHTSRYTDRMSLPTQPEVSLRELFLAFLRIAVAGIGGVLPHAQHQLVVRTGWLTQREFADYLSAGQLLPGPNIVNVAIMVGARYRGLAGSLCAVAGMMLVPFVFVLLLAAFYRSFGEEPYVREVFNGISAGAAGLMFATGVKLALSQPRVAWVLILIAAAFVLVGPLRLPLIAVLAALAPIAIAVAAWAARRGRAS